MKIIWAWDSSLPKICFKPPSHGLLSWHQSSEDHGWESPQILVSSTSSQLSQAWLIFATFQTRGSAASWQLWTLLLPKTSFSVLVWNILSRFGRHQPLCTSSIKRAFACSNCWHCFHLMPFKTLKLFSPMSSSQVSTTYSCPTGSESLRAKNLEEICHYCEAELFLGNQSHRKSMSLPSWSKIAPATQPRQWNKGCGSSLQIHPHFRSGNPCFPMASSFSPAFLFCHPKQASWFPLQNF